MKENEIYQSIWSDVIVWQVHCNITHAHEHTHTHTQRKKIMQSLLEYVMYLYQPICILVVQSISLFFQKKISNIMWNSK